MQHGKYVEVMYHVAMGDITVYLQVQEKGVYTVKDQNCLVLRMVKFIKQSTIFLSKFAGIYLLLAEYYF
jgi:hypothetical protein